MSDSTDALPCPHCQQPMLVESCGEVEVDICPEHGVWLDAGELELIVAQRRELDEARRIQLGRQRRRRTRRRRERRQAEGAWQSAVSPLFFQGF